jgi:hypothetical protein
MSILARTLAILSALVIAAIAIGFVGLLWYRPSTDVGTDMLRISAAIDASDTGKWIATGIAVAVILYAVAGVLAAAWPRERLIELRAGEHESVRIAPSTLEHQLEDVVREAGQVREARVEAHADGDRSVALDLEVVIPPQAEVASVVADVQRRLATALASQYGISMSKKPRIEVRYMDRDRPPRGHRRFITGIGGRGREAPSEQQ